MKQLTLDLAATAFLGGSLGPAMDSRVARTDPYGRQSTVSPVRRALPGMQLHHGIRGSGLHLLAWLGTADLRSRRERCGDDLLSQLCRATTDSGTPLSA